MGREKWDRHGVSPYFQHLSSSRERSELSTLLLGSYKQPTTHNQRGKNGDRLHFRREEPSLGRAGRGERREREREREGEGGTREKWDRHERFVSPYFRFRLLVSEANLDTPSRLLSTIANIYYKKTGRL